MGPYESEWWNSTATIRQKRVVLLLCGQLRQENKFTAGPFTDLNLPTFVKVGIIKNITNFLSIKPHIFKKILCSYLGTYFIQFAYLVSDFKRGLQLLHSITRLNLSSHH